MDEYNQTVTLVGKWPINDHHLVIEVELQYTVDSAHYNPDSYYESENFFPHYLTLCVEEATYIELEETTTTSTASTTTTQNIYDYEITTESTESWSTTTFTHTRSTSTESVSTTTTEMVTTPAVDEFNCWDLSNEEWNLRMIDYYDT